MNKNGNKTKTKKRTRTRTRKGNRKRTGEQEIKGTYASKKETLIRTVEKKATVDHVKK